MIRVTGGSLRGQTLKVPRGLETRPTLSKVRSALFDSIQSARGACTSSDRVLDLFSGSGILGFEALSRGAGSAVFVEKSPKVCRLIIENARHLGVESAVKVISGEWPKVAGRVLKLAPFDLVLADPPYDRGWALRVADWVAGHPQHIRDNGIVSIEWREKGLNSLPGQAGTLGKWREKRYGDTRLSLYFKEGMN